MEWYGVRLMPTRVLGLLQSIAIDQRPDKKFRQGLPWWLNGKEYACQCRRHGLDPWSGKISQPWNGKMLAPLASLKKRYDKPRQRIKNQRHHFGNRGPYSLTYGFSSSHVQMWELDHKGWALKNWCFLTVVLEKTLESTLDCKINSVSPKLICHKISDNNPDYSLEGLMLKLKFQ